MSILSAYPNAKIAGNFFLFAATTYCHWPLIFFVLIVTSHGIAATHETSLQGSNAPSHMNFFHHVLRGRKRVLSCAKDPNVCSDREKNPWGGSTCCFQQFCKDTMKDMNHCGECGRACAYGHVCRHGKCVDIRNDPHHCGSCFEECSGQSRCSYAMCEYGG